MRENRLRRHRPTSADVELLLGIAQEEFTTADLLTTNPRGRFIHAYDSARALADLVVRASGYRARGERHHMTLFEALGLLVPELIERADYFQTVRDKRNTLLYTQPEPVTQTEANEALLRARELDAFVRSWIARSHPALMPKPQPPKEEPPQDQPPNPSGDVPP